MLVPLFIGWVVAAGLRYALDKPQAEWVADVLAKGSSKPTINVGAGCGRSFASSEWGDLKCDIQPSGECFYCDVADLSQIPDKTYSVALASHLLEHTPNPEHALKEIQRIADNVVVVLPAATSAFAWLVPGHRHVILGNQVVPNYAPLAWAVVGLVGICALGYSRRKRHG